MKGTPATLMQQWRDEKAQKARLTSDPIDSFDASIHLHHVCIFKAHFPSSPFSLYPSSIPSIDCSGFLIHSSVALLFPFDSLERQLPEGIDHQATI
jgi:hypothetical protein